ncbi:Rieske (2Fe-2S) protein [Cellulosimicrobium sp. NPDC057127]|uniref:Rieske (2Fe-2S) protein n=1 Tax=Cellulosimicrobium sp. NPDC057127 TaxID=3346026 RepID=UPI003625022E
MDAQHDDAPRRTAVARPGVHVPRASVPVPGPTRRAVLAGSGAGAALAVLAACGGGPATGARDEPAGTGSQGSGVPAGEVLAQADDVPVGGAVAVTVDDAPVLVTRPAEETFAAFSAVCTHQGCTVGPGEGELVCPCHASRFDLATGAVLGGPAPSPLTEVAVTVDGGRVTSA